MKKPDTKCTHRGCGHTFSDTCPPSVGPTPLPLNLQGLRACFHRHHGTVDTQDFQGWATNNRPRLCSPERWDLVSPCCVRKHPTQRHETTDVVCAGAAEGEGLGHAERGWLVSPGKSRRLLGAERRKPERLGLWVCCCELCLPTCVRSSAQRRLSSRPPAHGPQARLPRGGWSGFPHAAAASWNDL